MAVTKSEMEREDIRRWLKTSQEKAFGLLAHAKELSSDVFSGPDNLLRFLGLTVRLHHFDANNLLLLWERYPTASCLAGYKIWERQLPAGAQILKKEHRGKGIELIAPFTDASTPQNKLVWFTVNVYDVSQTTLRPAPAVFDPAYIHDDNHIYFLLDALRTALSAQFNRSVIIQPPSQLMLEAGLPGQITDRSVIVRSDSALSGQLQWLTEALAQLATHDIQFSLPATQLLKNCIVYCLLCIWGLENEARPPASLVQLQAVAPQELLFLHTLRDAVRYLNNLICSCYTARRNDADLLLSDDDLDDLV